MQQFCLLWSHLSKGTEVTHTSKATVKSHQGTQLMNPMIHQNHESNFDV